MLERQDYNGATHAFQQVLQRDSNHCATLSQLATLARLADQLGDTTTFTRHYQMALELSEQPYAIHLALAQTRADNGNNVGAAEQYRLSLALQPDSFEANSCSI